MKRLVALFASLVFAGCLQAQTAKVIQLSPEDAAKAKALYAQKADIEKQIDDLQQKITATYLAKNKEIQESWGWYPWPWLNGFEFSDDFKFIVPKTGTTGTATTGTITIAPYYTYPCPYSYYPYGWFYSGTGVTTGVTTGSNLSITN